MNDLPACVNSKVRLFADDCLLYRETKNNHDQIVQRRAARFLQTILGVKQVSQKCYTI